MSTRDSRVVDLSFTRLRLCLRKGLPTRGPNRRQSERFGGGRVDAVHDVSSHSDRAGCALVIRV